MTSQTISFNSLSYSFVSDLPKLTSEPKIESGKKPLQGIQIPAKPKEEDPIGFKVPSKIKTNDVVSLEVQKTYGGGSLKGAEAIESVNIGAPASNAQIESFNDNFTDLLVGEPGRLVEKGKEKTLTLQGTKTAPNVTATSTKDFSDLTDANKTNFKTPTNTANGNIVIPTTTKGKEESTTMQSFEAPIQSSKGEEKLIKTVEVKDANGQTTGLASVLNLENFSSSLTKSNGSMNLLKKKDEEEGSFGEEYVKGSKNLSMFASWGEGANDLDKSFKIADDIGVFFGSDSKQEFTNSGQLINLSGSEAYGNDSTSFHFEWGDKTLGISDLDSEMLANSKMVGKGNYVTLKAMQDAKDWKEFGESFKKIFGSKKFWGEVLGSVTDAGIEWGKDVAKSLINNFFGGKEKMPDPSKYNTIVFGEGLTDFKDTYKDLLGNEPGFETKKPGKKLEFWNKQKGIEAETTDYYLEKIGNTIVQIKKSATTRETEAKQKAGKDKSWIDKNRSKIEDTVEAIVDRDGGIAGEFENAMISQIATQKHQIVDQSAAIKEMISQDPLLSQYQFDLQIPPRKIKVGEEVRSALSSSMYQQNDTENGYTNYRVKGITFPAYKRKVTDTHYGVHTLSTHTDLYASADHTATISIVVDKKMEVLEKLIGNMTGNGHVAANYINLSTVSSADASNDQTIATLTIRNGRDLAKSIFMENPDWRLDQEQNIGTAQDKTGYDTTGTNFDTSSELAKQAKEARDNGNEEKAKKLEKKAEAAKNKDLTTHVKKMVLSYNLLPKFKFSGFKFINLDYSFNFDTESGNVFEIKATVTWSKAEIIMQPAYDVYYAAGQALASESDEKLAKDVKQKEAKKTYKASLKSRDSDRKLQQKAEAEAKKELNELKKARDQVTVDYYTNLAVQTTLSTLPSLQPVAQPTNMFITRLDPKLVTAEAMKKLEEDRDKAYAELDAKIKEQNKKLKEAQSKLDEIKAQDDKAKKEAEDKLADFEDRYNWSAMKEKFNISEPGEMLKIRQ